MQMFVSHRQRGTAIAFILMALIAILAIVVVLLSRARRENQYLIEPPPHDEVTTGVKSSQEFTTSAPVQSVSPSTSTGFQGNMPPPPPPLAPTPDKRDLPPEG